MSEDDRATVVLVEDHGLIAHTLAAALAVDGTRVRALDPAEHDDLVAAVVDTEPSLALLDLDLGPRGSSLGLIGPIRDADIPVVIVTGTTDPVAHAACVEAGAAGLIDKAGSFDDLVDGVARVLDGDTLLHPADRDRHLALLRRHRAAERERLAPFEQLTPREAHVLGSLMRGRSVDQIASAEVVSVTTVRSHVRGILTKLGVKTQLAAIARATEAGWQTPTDA